MKPGDNQQHNEKKPLAASDTDDAQGGKVEPGAIFPEDNSMEQRGEGDRTDTDEMHRLNDDSGQ